MTKSSVLKALTLSFVLISTPALANDMWLLPPKKPQISQECILLLSTGLRFPRSGKALGTSDIDSVWVVTPENHRTPLSLGEPQKRSTQISFTPTRDGIYVVAATSNTQSNKSGSTERAQYAKALVRIGDTDTGYYGSPVGLEYEIVPMTNPFALRMGDQLPIQVIYHGKPQAGAWVRWTSNKPVPSDQMGLDGMTRANDQGKAAVPINATGPIMIHVTHMPPKSGNAQQTLRTTLTWIMPSRKL